jgi:hypothetical protein
MKSCCTLSRSDVPCAEPLRAGRAAAFAILFALPVLLSCGDSSGPPDPGALAFVSAPAQGVAGTTLGEPVIVQVSDRAGRPMRNMRVSWTVTEGSVSAAETVSDATGRAQVLWTLGTRVGAYTLTARIGEGTPIVVTATALTGPVATVAILPDNVFLTALGDTVRLRATAQDAYGNAIDNPTIAWSVDPAGVAFINASGLLRADGTGEGTITARTGTGTGTAPLRVVQEPFAVSISRPFAETLAGDSVLLSASVRDARGSLIAGDGLLWSSVDDAIAAVSQNGWVRGVSDGSTMVRAASVSRPEIFTDIPVYVGLNLSIAGLYITQSSQTFGGTVPLVADRAAFLRVFVRASGANAAAPAVRVQFMRNGAVVDTHTIEAPAASVPNAVNEGSLLSSWNVPLPASLIQPGLSVIAEVDPDNSVLESNEDDNTFPANGIPLSLDVRSIAPFRARFVPVIQSENDLMGDVTVANMHSYMPHTQAVYPIPSYDIDVRAPYTFVGALPSQYGTDWSRLLGEIRMLRTAEGSDRYYYGVLQPAYTSGGTGLGYIGLPAAIGVDWLNWRSYTAAHEWGHNFGRLHVDCGNPGGLDPNYPYANGRIGAFGYDVRPNVLNPLKLPEVSADLLSYCPQNVWISDYTYRAVMDFRGTMAGPAAMSAPQRTLLVWGRITDDDGIVLEPAFEVVTRPSLPDRAGPHRVEALDAAGARIFDLAFEATLIDHIEGERHFAYAVPIDGMPAGAIAALRLTAQGRQVELRRRGPPPQAGPAARDVRVSRGTAGRVQIEWDVADTRAVLVRDAATGDILSIGRNGRAEAVATVNEIDIVTSDGVGSTTRRVRVPR